MHIVFVTTELASTNNASNGLGTFTANMAHIFKENGHKVSIVLVSTKAVHPEAENDIDLYNFYVPLKIWKKIDMIAKVLSSVTKHNRVILRRTIILKYKSRKTKKIIQCIHKKNSIDIIHCSHHVSLYGRCTKNIPYIVRISNIGNIWTGANMPQGSVNYIDNPVSIRDKVEEKNIKMSRYAVAPSYLLADIVNKYLEVNINVIESSFLLEKNNWNDCCMEQYNLKDKKYVIHYGGTLRYFKGTHVVAKLAKRLLQKYPDLYLVLSGASEDMQDEKGNIMKAHELVKQGAEEYADRVIYVGQLVREQLYPLIQHAEICLLPSRIENLANACIEAMALGKIVVATNGASYEQLIDNRINGFLCERDNPESFLQGIEMALSLSKEEKKTMENKALETTKRFSPDKIYKQYLDFYEKAIREW